LSDAFPQLLLQRMEVAQTVEIETASGAGEVHRVRIWIVVVAGTVYVRSVRGKKGRWYRELLARKKGALIVGSRSVDVRPVAVKSTEKIDEASAALWRKYPRSPSLFSMLRLAVLDTTLRLEPA
jgi:hypothetical protein